MLTFAYISAIIFAAFLYFYWKLRKTYSLWSELGIPGPKPLPLIGNGLDIIRNNRAEIDFKWSRKYGKIYGYYMGVFPNLVITDPELIKQVFVKDFHHFVNRLRLNAYHEMWNTNLLVAEDEDWKRIRTIVTPAFTSGKLKSMYGLMNQCIEKLTAYLTKVVQKEGGIIGDTKKVFSGFAIDIIASTSFGTETNANGDREKEDPLVYNGKQLFNIIPIQAFTALALPRWFNNLVGNKTLFQLAPFEFFISLMREIIKQRKGQTTKRPDLVQLMIDAAVDEQLLKDVQFEQLTASNESEEAMFESSETEKKKKQTTLSDNEIISSCILFFNAGFETTSGTIVHCCYEMAKNPDVQERLYKIIVKATEGLDPKSDEFFDVIVNRLPYLEAAIMETLRMYPPIAIILRRLKTDGYVLAGYKLPKDTAIEASTYSIHHSECYYPDPESFQPERFLPENKHELVPYTFLPFGTGPRNCVGMRFALQEMKLCFGTILKQFRFERAPGTPDKIEFSKGTPLLLTKTFPLKIVQRQ